MFQLTEQEWNLISSQFVMTSRMKRPKKSLPFAFTELGALILSSVLRSPVAIETSIKITRAFVAMRQMLTYSTLPEKVVNLAQELYKLKEEVNDILAENEIRPITLGRKNYLFCGNHEAAGNMAVVCSLLATCKAHDVNPRNYLIDVISQMPYNTKASYKELLQLLPHKWKLTHTESIMTKTI